MEMRKHVTWGQSCMYFFFVLWKRAGSRNTMLHGTDHLESSTSDSANLLRTGVLNLLPGKLSAGLERACTSSSGPG